MLEIGMLDLGLLMGEGELAGEVALLLAASPKISEFIKRSPLQGKLLKKRLQSWGEQLARRSATSRCRWRWSRSTCSIRRIASYR